MPSNSPPYSYVRYTGNGSTTQFAINFDYLSSTHLSISLDGVIQSSGVSIDNNVPAINFGSAPSSGQVIIITRTTPKTKSGFQSDIADFTDGSILTAADLDQATLGLLYIAQEAEDSGASNALNLDLTDQKWDATNAGSETNIKNVATPTENSHAVTKQYVDGLSLYNSPTPLSVYTFTGNSSLTAFTMTPAPPSSEPEAFIVDIGGIAQRPTTDYTVAGAVMTFTTAPPAETITIRNIGVSRDFLVQPFQSDAIGTPSLQIKGITDQTADLQQWQNTSGTALAKVDKDGDGTFVDLTATGNSSVSGNAVVSGTLTANGGGSVNLGTVTGTTVTGTTVNATTLTTTGNITASGGIVDVTGASGSKIAYPGSVVQTQFFKTPTSFDGFLMTPLYKYSGYQMEYAEATAVGVEITPKSATSVIKVEFTGSLGFPHFNIGLELQRTVDGSKFWCAANSSTAIWNGNDEPEGDELKCIIPADYSDDVNEDENTPQPYAFTYIDTPNTTSTVKYNISIILGDVGNGAKDVGVGRGRGVSERSPITLVATEIAQ